MPDERIIIEYRVTLHVRGERFYSRLYDLRGLASHPVRPQLARDPIRKIVKAMRFFPRAIERRQSNTEVRAVVRAFRPPLPIIIVRGATLFVTARHNYALSLSRSLGGLALADLAAARYRGRGPLLICM